MGTLRKDWQLALDAKLKQERTLAAQAVGVEIVHQAGKRLLSHVIGEYNAETKKHKAKRTHAAYNLTLALFQDATLGRATRVLWHGSRPDGKV
jgi:hypothetical protein